MENSWMKAVSPSELCHIIIGWNKLRLIIEAIIYKHEYVRQADTNFNSLIFELNKLSKIVASNIQRKNC